MKLLVGTLYTIENEFEQCCAAIDRQTYDHFDLVVIRNLPNIGNCITNAIDGSKKG
jgi:hypothetical protein